LKIKEALTINNIHVFNNSEFGQVRTILKENQVWFVAKDVCDCLALTNPTMSLQRLDEDEATKFNLGGRVGETNIVNEYGLYNLVLGSRKPEAKRFKRWITHEVLPSIRKHGAYMTPSKLEEVLLSPDTIIHLAQNLKEEMEKRKAAENQVKEMKPKALFAEAVETSHTSILVGDLAKLLRQNGVNTGSHRLFEWLRQNGFLIKRGSSRNMPTQYSMDLGLFEVKERAFTNPDGSVRVTRTTKVTGKGQVYFINKFLRESA